MALTFTRSSSTILTVYVNPHAVAPSIFRRRIATLSTSKLQTVRTAGGPRGPRGPLSVHRGADLVAGLLLEWLPLAGRTSVDRGWVVALAGTFANPATAIGVAFRPFAPSTPFAGN